MSDGPSPTGFRPIRFLLLACSVSFVIIMAGAQLSTALLPLYATELSLDPVALSLAYGLYLISLVVALLVSARPSMHGRPGLVLLLALVATLAADIVTGTASLPGFLAGRVLNGLALGFAGGAAASLAVAAQGPRARTIVATSTVVGGLSGTIGAVLLAETLPEPLHLTYVVHGAVTVVLLVVLAVALHSARARPRFVPSAEVTEKVFSYRPSTGFVLGTVAWVCGTLIVVLVPNGAMRTIPGVGLVTATLGTVTMLTSAVIAQYALAGLRPRIAMQLSFATLLMGMLALASGLALQLIWLVFVGCAIVGLGEGLGYRSGLRIVSGGLTSRQQGARTSAYSSLAYGASAVVVIAAGGVIAQLGYGLGTFILGLCFIPVTIFYMVRIETDYRRGAEL